MKNKIQFTALLFGLSLALATAQTNSRNVPPMGWEPWNIDHCGGSWKWDDDYYRKLADFFVNSGLKEAGYQYITFECDDLYRDTNGVLHDNLAKFPQGLRSINDCLHSKGLKARAYTDAGFGKCCCFDGSGSLGHYAEDARQWVEWHFDGVKIDWCGGNTEKLDPKKQYLEFHDAIVKCNPNFNIEICCWGNGNPWEWGRQAGTFWRTGSDIDGYMEDGKWVVAAGGCWKTLLRNIEANNHPDKNLVGPGLGWNYPDMLVVGLTGGLNVNEQRTQFSLWCIMASPLFLGNDVFSMSPFTRDTVMNKEVIAVDQDALGIQGKVVREYNQGSLQVWMKELADGSRAVALFNRSDKAEKITANWKDLGTTGKWYVRDLWKHADLGQFAESYSAQVEPHATVLLKLFVSSQVTH